MLRGLLGRIVGGGGRGRRRTGGVATPGPGGTASGAADVERGARSIFRGLFGGRRRGI